MTDALEVSQRSDFDPLGAGALLATVVVACIGLGAAIGAVAGSVEYGVVAGAMLGVPASIAAIIYRYRDGV
jgi:hypothetical protein